MINPHIASARPCPIGCSGSAGRCPMLNPIYAIIDVATSDNVCAPSEISA